MASTARDDPSTLPGDDPFPCARMHSQCMWVRAVNLDRNLNLKLAIIRQCTSVTDRQTDTDIVAKARDVYITSRAKNEMKM